MSGGLVRENFGSDVTQENFGKFNINSRPVKSIRERMNEARTLPQVNHKGSWCVYDQDKFCQESRCCDCEASQQDQ